MAERKFLSSAETLRPRTTSERARGSDAPFGTSAATALSSPLFRYGNRILDALREQQGSMPVSALLAKLQTDLGDGFNLTEALAVLGALQSAGALSSDGRTCRLTEQGRALSA